MMSQVYKASDASKSLTCAKKNTRDQQSLLRKSKGRSLAFQIVDARKKLTSIGLGTLQSGRKLKTQGAKIETEIAQAERQLVELGFNVKEAVAAAIQYRIQSQDEAREPKPVAGDGVGFYRLGNQKRHWK